MSRIGPGRTVTTETSAGAPRRWKVKDDGAFKEIRRPAGFTKSCDCESCNSNPRAHGGES